MRTSEKDRLELLTSGVDENQTVLDIGAARHDKSRRSEANLHQRLVDTGAKVIGVDILAEEAEKMRDQGYDVRVGDAESLSNLDIDQVDVIVAGEVIEHLSNPGLFFNEASKVTGDDGELLISTPNPHAFVFTKKAIFGENNNPEHTCWFDPQFLEQLSRRYGWCVSKSWYVTPDGGISRIIFPISKALGSPNFVSVLEKVEVPCESE